MEVEGQFITLAREWIGSLVNYEEKTICYSEMFVEGDRFYTDLVGARKDECEYFVQGILNGERIFIQNTVFDTLFEIKFDYGKDFHVF